MIMGTVELGPKYVMDRIMKDHALLLLSLIPR